MRKQISVSDMSEEYQNLTEKEQKLVLRTWTGLLGPVVVGINNHLREQGILDEEQILSISKAVNEDLLDSYFNAKEAFDEYNAR